MKRVKFKELAYGQYFMRQNMTQFGYFSKLVESSDNFGLFNAYQLSSPKNTIYIEADTYVLIDEEKDTK